MKKITVKQITTLALLLALCIASQFFKNLSVYITGPIVNAIIIIATLSTGLVGGLIISIIAPITSFIITGSFLLASMPLLIPAIMIGNALLAISVWFFEKKFSFKLRLPAGLVIGSIIKAIAMGLLIVLIIFPLFGDNLANFIPKPEAAPVILAGAKITFSVTQLVTALIGSVFAYIIWMPLKKVLKNEQ